MNTSRGFVLPVLLLIIVGLFVLGGAGYYFTNTKGSPQQTSENEITTTCTANGNTYANGTQVYVTTTNGAMPITDRVICQNGKWYDQQASGYIQIDANASVRATEPAEASSQISGASASAPSIIITKVSGSTVTVQYANLPAATSLSVQNEGLSNPSLEVPLNGSPSGTASFTLPKDAMSGVYTVTPIDANNSAFKSVDYKVTHLNLLALFRLLDGSISITNSSEPASVMSASPISGTAPLIVTFSNIWNGPSDETIEFGDGKNQGMGPTGKWPATGVTHTYAAPGTYTATLYRYLPYSAVGTVTITVK